MKPTAGVADVFLPPEEIIEDDNVETQANDDETISALAARIELHGQGDPVVVRAIPAVDDSGNPTTRYQLLHGRAVCRAIRVLNAATEEAPRMVAARIHTESESSPKSESSPSPGRADAPKLTKEQPTNASKKANPVRATAKKKKKPSPTRTIKVKARGSPRAKSRRQAELPKHAPKKKKGGPTRTLKPKARTSKAR